MQDLSLHILDLVENSLAAGASTVRILIDEDPALDRLTVEIIDNGAGMDEETTRRALDPFYTTKSVRKVGLGLSLFREAARAAGGDLVIVSKLGRGTRIKASFCLSHLDCKPMGDLGQTLLTLVIGQPEVRFYCRLKRNGILRIFDSRYLRDPGRSQYANIIAVAASTRKKLRRFMRTTAS